MTMSTNRLRLLAPSALALGALLSGPAAAQQDKIVSKDGKERTAKVESEDYDGLKLSVQGGTTSMPWKDVDSIKYGNAAKYQEAIEAAATQAPGQAVQALEALAADDKLRPVLKHGVLYNLGLAWATTTRRSRPSSSSCGTFRRAAT
jgi:hypothetical protein